MFQNATCWSALHVLPHQLLELWSLIYNSQSNSTLFTGECKYYLTSFKMFQYLLTRTPCFASSTARALVIEVMAPYEKAFKIMSWFYLLSAHCGDYKYDWTKVIVPFLSVFFKSTKLTLTWEMSQLITELAATAQNCPNFISFYN